jgi:hypothetical protein
MKKLLFCGLMACALVLFNACGKSSSSGGSTGGGTTGGTTSTEEKLSVKLSAAAIETSPSSSFTFTADIQSKLPAGGVTIKVEVKRDDNNAVVYSIQANSSVLSNSFTISPLPPGQVYCTATVTVTSASTASNSWTGSFKVLWK